MGTEWQYKNYLKDVVSIVRENIEDLKQRKNFADPAEQAYISTRLFTYNEMISIFKMELKKYQISKEELGLED